MKNNRYSKYIFSVSVVLVLSMWLTGCGKSEVSTTTNESKNVNTVVASTSSIENYSEYGSTLNLSSEVSISPKISGKIGTMNVEAGQKVKKGDVLFTLDGAELQAQYNQAQSALSLAQANYSRTTDSQFQQQLIEAQQTQSLAQNAYNDAQNTFNNVNTLYNEGKGTKQNLDDANSKLNSAQIQLNSANDALNLLNGKGSRQTADIAQAQVEQSQSAVALAKSQLDNTVIKSPIDGIVLEKDANVGEMVISQKSVVVLGDDSGFTSEINISDKDLSGINIGQKVEVQSTESKNKDFDGTIDSISPSADPKTQLYKVKVKVTNKDVSLKSGMLIKVLLPNEKKDNVIAIPNNALVVNNGVQYIYEVVDGIVKKSQVDVGITDGKNTEITNGIKTGDNIIIEGQSFLNDGDSVIMN